MVHHIKLYQLRLKRACVLAQRRWRRILAAKVGFAALKRKWAATLIQKWWRGLVGRQTLRRSSPDKALHLREIGWRLLDLQDVQFNLFEIRMAIRFVKAWKRAELRIMRMHRTREVERRHVAEMTAALLAAERAKAAQAHASSFDAFLNAGTSASD
jgi:hypothetical protein